jgi:fucose permease
LKRTTPPYTAQGGTLAFFINYGVEKMHFSDKTAAGFFSLFMVMIMTGRFVGTFLMRYLAPNKLLATFALANAKVPHRGPKLGLGVVHLPAAD